MDRENERGVLDDVRTIPEKENRRKNVKAHTNYQKYSNLICAGQRTERKDKTRRKGKLGKRNTFRMGGTKLSVDNPLNGMDREALKKASESSRYISVMVNKL